MHFRSSCESAGFELLSLFSVLLPSSWTTVVCPAASLSPLNLSVSAPAEEAVFIRDSITTEDPPKGGGGGSDGGLYS